MSPLKTNLRVITARICGWVLGRSLEEEYVKVQEA